MWNTSAGERVLTGAEAALFMQGFDDLVDGVEFAIKEQESGWSGVAYFDALSGEQQLVLLSEVGAALLRRDVPAPALTAVNEAAVAACYERLGAFTDDPILAIDSGIAYAVDASALERLLR